MNQTEYANLERARKARNPITYFRRPLHGDTIEYRAVIENELPYTIIEDDAQNVMEIVLHLLNRSAV